MDYEVLKPFTTVNRRLAPGKGPAGTFAEGDDPRPFELEERVKSGFIKPVAEPVSEAAPAADEPAKSPGRVKADSNPL